MSSKVPVIRQIAWFSIVPQLLVMGGLMFIWYQFNQTEFILYGAITYLIISQLLRRIISSAHREGMSKVKQEAFAEAIPLFERSYAFFQKNDWVDKYRYLTLLSSTKMTYQEMALVNIAFCYGQLGDGQRSKEYYEKTLQAYPDNSIAKVGLRMLNAMSDGI